MASYTFCFLSNFIVKHVAEQKSSMDLVAHT